MEDPNKGPVRTVYSLYLISPTAAEWANEEGYTNIFEEVELRGSQMMVFLRQTKSK